MNLRLEWLWMSCTVASVSAGCGGEAERPPPATDPSTETGTNLPRPGAPAGEASAGSTEATGSCVDTDCPEVTALGSAVAGCCQENGQCGGLVSVMGMPLCAPPNVDSLVMGAGAAIARLMAEEIVTDPSCGARNVFGTMLPGCCDATGVCGVSTAPVAVGSPGAVPGLALPLTCVTPAEAELLAGGAVLGNLAPEACSGPGDAGAPAADAGADGS